jgi:hypothetical protein
MMKRLLATLVILTGLIGSGGDVWAQDFNRRGEGLSIAVILRLR